MKTYTKVCPRAGHESFFEISFCKAALPFLCLHFGAPGYLRRPFPLCWVLIWLWSLQEMMKREGMIVAILMSMWVVLTTRLRILIRNFIPVFCKEKKKNRCGSLETMQHVCIPLCPHLQTALQKSLSLPRPLDLACLERVSCFPLKKRITGFPVSHCLH